MSRSHAATAAAAARGERTADAPVVRLPYPGPRAAAVIERLRRVEGAGLRTGGPEAPLVVESGTGALLIDPDGNRFVDLYGSFAAATLGHAHPAVTAAVREQAGRIAHVSSAFASEARVAFEEALLAIAPPGLERVILGISGTDANETALRLARTLTGRREVIVFSGGYFGRSAAVVGLAGKTGFRARLGEGAGGHFLPFPYRYRWRLGPPEEAGRQALALVEEAVVGPASGIGSVAAILVEPVQGNGGVIVPPDDFLPGLRELCDRHGIVLIFDEIQSGFGRTGLPWAGQHWQVTPDLMTVGKGIGGGLAVSAVVGRAAMMGHWPPGTHTSTFLADAVNLAAGRAALEVMARERLWQRSARLGAALLERLRAGLADAPHVGEVRGLGLFVGIEIVADHASRAPDAERAAALRRAAFERGLIVGGGGHAENVLKLAPPLVIEEALLEHAAELLLEVIRRDA
ncbi:MAG TPA: aspartate aminotransferase family protein [Candidatus Limnocylindrales bacterium]|nr:aspartate aminotransferase family protein [Candidatus Limnocylindrales bacterium]